MATTELKHTNPIVSRILEDVLERVPETSSGTYNRQDPTHYSKGKETFEYKGENYTIYYKDSTWAIDIIVYKGKDIFGKICYQGLITFPDKKRNVEVIWTTPIKGLYLLLNNFIKTHEPYVEPDYSEDPFGHPSMYI